MIMTIFAINPHTNNIVKGIIIDQALIRKEIF